MDSEKCYVFRRRDVRPIKRRRLEGNGLETSLEARLATFKTEWGRQQQCIDGVIQDACAITFEDLDQFLEELSDDREAVAKLPVAIIPTGHGSSAGDILFDQICKHSTERDATNPGPRSAGDDDEELAPLSKGPRLLKYDLQVLYNWCQARGMREVTVAVPDGDSLEPALLNDLIMLLRSWQSRLRFTLLLGVSAPLQIFHDRLSYSATHMMETRLIKAMPIADISSKIFESLQLDPKAPCRLGPNLSELLTRRQTTFPQPIESFVASIKYTYMSHFYGNALSVLLSPSSLNNGLDSLHCDAIRTLTSFRAHVDQLIARGEAARARELLESDATLAQEINSELEASRSLVAWKLGACNLMRTTIEDVKLPNPPPSLEAYTNALSGAFCRPQSRRELMLYMKKAPLLALSALSVKAKDILMTLPPSNVDISPDEFTDLAESLAEEAEQHSENAKVAPDGKPVDSRPSQLKPGPSKAKDSFCELLARLFEQTLQPYTNIFLHEVLFYDNRSPYTETFTPRTSSAIERALSAPKHYLGCRCCADGEGSLRPTNPPTAILYQLYVESGALINVHDLLLAFKLVLEKTVTDEQKLMALFYRGLAELKSLGLVKHSRRRADHIAKLGWKGL